MAYTDDVPTGVNQPDDLDPAERARMRAWAFRAAAVLLLFIVVVSRGPRVLPRGAATLPDTAIARDSSTAATISWALLARLDYKNGVIPPEIGALDGRDVRIPGFVVPLEDFTNAVTEFLLVPYFGACIHTPPPPPSQMIFAQLEENDIPVRVNTWDPIWLEGKLQVKTIESPYGSVGYALTVKRLEPYVERR
jgi:hypothetical protein